MEDEHGRSTSLDVRKRRILFTAVIVPHGWTECAKHFIACQEELELITAEEALSLEYFMGLIFNSEAVSFRVESFFLFTSNVFAIANKQIWKQVKRLFCCFIIFLSHLYLIFLVVNCSLTCVSVPSSLRWVSVHLQPQRKYIKQDIQYLEMWI